MLYLCAIRLDCVNSSVYLTTEKKEERIMKKLVIETFPSAILAGICISIGCVVNLRVGGVAGAVLFAFGLTTVV